MTSRPPFQAYRRTVHESSRTGRICRSRRARRAECGRSCRRSRLRPLGATARRRHRRNIDRLRRAGCASRISYTAFFSPPRAALDRLQPISRRHARARQLDTGYPNCTGTVSKSAATIAEVLRPTGYSSFAVGKWHLTPMEQTSPAGPFDQWPLARGFDRFYGFLEGETDQWHPDLTADNHSVQPPKTPEEGYHLSEDLVDQAISMVRAQKVAVAEKPFFLYVAFGATHRRPLIQAPKN